MSNPHQPLDEFALLAVCSRIQGGNNFQECFLKKIVGHHGVFNRYIDVTVQFTLVPFYEKLETFMVALDIIPDQKFITHRLGFHVTSCLNECTTLSYRRSSFVGCNE
ncbi:hypothetical protein SDC9_71168 [bioreactor metagenome]|uniref:Uncharacterized protein n=1 Tax=bioreactor metagenome TaxID=1076179 RepID=A0A644YEZ7_9ZZZZ